MTAEQNDVSSILVVGQIRVSFILLPPVNEFWGKVIFSEACVRNSVHTAGRGGSAAVHARIPPLPLLGCNLVEFIELDENYEKCSIFAKMQLKTILTHFLNKKL